ncbi:transcriptional regulator, AraC family [Pseudoalteromonas luteoviolacea B = ATCC 29581]|nr:transcriptional regulator, AraC family [Pseudoalteromonas luteoviolacea B = ATCC 29581]
MELSQENALSLVLSCSSVAIALFIGHLFFLRAVKYPVYVPLIACVLSCAILLSQPLWQFVAPIFQIPMLSFSLPALYSLPVFFWLYVKGLTQTTPWSFTCAEAKHFVLPSLGVIIAITALLLPKDVQRSLFVHGRDEALSLLPAWLQVFTYGMLIITFVMVLAWIVYACTYGFWIWRRLAKYKAQLKTVFSSTETQEARWITWLLTLIGVSVLCAGGVLFLDNLAGPIALPSYYLHGMGLWFIWGLSVWGLRQKPGFSTFYASDLDTQALVSSIEQKKYQNSGLQDAQAQNIAQKIHRVMNNEQLFLDSTLSLPKLAKHVSCAPNYVSQTLNDVMKTTFFDYVNEWRIERAKQLLIESNDTVLNIAFAVGFNAKSSFYTAFKKCTAMTPTQFRKMRQHK